MPIIKLKKFQKISKGKYFHGTGRRKESTARVRIIPGTGNIIINEKTPEDYFGSKFLIALFSAPLKLVGLEKKIDLSIFL